MFRTKKAEKPAVELGDYKKAVKDAKAALKKGEIWTPGKEPEKKNEEAVRVVEPEESHEAAPIAEEHAKEDEAKKDEIEARNKADTLIYQAEKSLKDAGDKVPADVKSEVEEKAKALREVQAAGPIDEVKTKTEELSSALSKIGESMYKGAEGPKGPDGAEGASTETKDENPSDDKKSDADTGDVQEGEVVKE